MPITPTTPLRLKVAAALAFPDGSMSEKALRELGHAGKLTVEIIRGKHFNTLADIEEDEIATPRPSKGARLYLAPARKGHEAGYVIRDLVDGRRVELPCTGGGKTDFAEAQRQLGGTRRSRGICGLVSGVPIENVSDYCGVSVHIIRRVYKHHLKGSHDPVLLAARRFGRT